MGLVAGVVAAGIGIEGTAPHLELERRAAGVPSLGSLEHHVLEQVGYAHLARGLVGAGGADPNAHRGGTDPGQALA